MKKLILLLIAVFLLPNITMADKTGFIKGQKCNDNEVLQGFDDRGGLICKDIAEIISSSSCGDGVVFEGIEQCDDGNTENTDACLNDCTLASCGDGYVWTGVEECDDGNLISGDGCDENCQLEPTPCSSDGDCYNYEYCNSSNLCESKKAIGYACSGNNECVSGSCADGVCCETACSDSGYACDNPGYLGQCTQTP